MERWVQRTIDHYALIQPSVGLHVDRGHLRAGRRRLRRRAGPERPAQPVHDERPHLRQGRVPDGHRRTLAGGHEPGNFGLFHLGKERGVSTALDPRNIPVYAWEDDGPKLTPLDRFERTALPTPYLEKPAR